MRPRPYFSRKDRPDEPAETPRLCLSVDTPARLRFLLPLKEYGQSFLESRTAPCRRSKLLSIKYSLYGWSSVMRTRGFGLSKPATESSWERTSFTSALRSCEALHSNI